MCFHHTNFVCGSAIQVGVAIAVHCIYCIQYPIYMCIYTVESACASSCGVWLAQWLVRMNAHRARAGSNPSAVHDRHFAASIGNQYYTVQYITSADSHPFPVRIQYCLQFPVTATRSISFLISSENSVLLIQYRTGTVHSVLLIQYCSFSTAHSVPYQYSCTVQLYCSFSTAHSVLLIQYY